MSLPTISILHTAHTAQWQHPSRGAVRAVDALGPVTGCSAGAAGSTVAGRTGGAVGVTGVQTGGQTGGQTHYDTRGRRGTYFGTYSKDSSGSNGGGDNSVVSVCELWCGRVVPLDLFVQPMAVSYLSAPSR